MMGINGYLSIAIGICAIIAMWFYAKSNKLEAELVVANASKSQTEANYNAVHKELESVKKVIDKNKVDYETNIASYEKAMKNVRKEVKYIEVKTDDCKDIKNILDDIRSNGY
jgi:signal recognition particle receptor subunit beta